METFLEPFQDSEGLTNVATTIFLIIFFLTARHFVNRAILRSKYLNSETRQRWRINARSALLALFFLGVIMVWGSTIQEVAFSLAALAVAFVIATKEVLLCVAGSFVRTASKAFSIGDRVEIDGVRGDVIDHTLLATTLLEVGPGRRSHQQTGRSVTIPNSIFLNHKVVNESFTEDYVLHVISVPMDRHEDWQGAESTLLEVASEETGNYLEPARIHFRVMASKQGIDPPLLEPRVILNFEDKDTVDLVLRVCVPGRNKGRIEQEILRKFMGRFHAKAQG